MKSRMKTLEQSGKTGEKKSSNESCALVVMVIMKRDREKEKGSAAPSACPQTAIRFISAFCLRKTEFRVQLNLKITLEIKIIRGNLFSKRFRKQSEILTKQFITNNYLVS